MESDDKSVIMEEMYEKTDLEKKTIREIKEITRMAIFGILKCCWI